MVFVISVFQSFFGKIEVHIGNNKITQHGGDFTGQSRGGKVQVKGKESTKAPRLALLGEEGDTATLRRPLLCQLPQWQPPMGRRGSVVSPCSVSKSEGCI